MLREGLHVMSKRMSAAQSTFLRLTANACEAGCSAYVPHSYDWLEGQKLAVSGGGAAAAYRALLRAGLIAASRLAPYAAAITDAGKAAAAREEGRPVAWSLRMAECKNTTGEIR